MPKSDTWRPPTNKQKAKGFRNVSQILRRRNGELKAQNNQLKTDKERLETENAMVNATLHAERVNYANYTKEISRLREAIEGVPFIVEDLLGFYFPTYDIEKLMADFNARMKLTEVEKDD
jgi:uncharacterized sporulation protein YeaH/YhbH (DUF444 family)